MKIAFLTEMGFTGKIPANHTNMRTEFAWMHALSADHFSIGDWKSIVNYDCVMVIFPKGGGHSYSIDGIKLIDKKNPYSFLFASSIITDLKNNNKLVCSIQEGPAWYSNDFDLDDQFNLYNRLFECDILFAHNKYDILWYKGLFPEKRVEIMPTLLIEELIQYITPQKENKVIIGGNFSRWYGGFQSFMVADEFNCQKYVQTSHSSRFGEDQIPGLTVLPRMYWFDWMKTLSKFKYAIHMMPTIAAGTFSLNCAYFGIPCVGNIKVDTQRICFPELSFDSEDVYNVRLVSKRLYESENFYKEMSKLGKENYQKYFSKEYFFTHINNILYKQIETNHTI
jgi:hypothetical protein